MCSPGTPLWNDSNVICFSGFFMQITQALLEVSHDLSLPLELAHWALPIETCPFSLPLSLPLQLAPSACPLSLLMPSMHASTLQTHPWHACMLCSCLNVQTTSRRCHIHLCTSLPACYHIDFCQTHFQVCNQQTIFSIQFLQTVYQ